MGGNITKDGRIDDSLENIADRVIGDDRTFNLHATRKRYDVIEVKQDPEDITKPLKGIATDLVVEEFFLTEDTLYKFLQYVYTTFSDALAIYREKRELKEFDVFFLYKGGSILRIISKEFLLELPGESMREISKFYAKYFKRSDADFSIYVNPDLSDYDNVYYELGLLSYLVQDKIRDWFCSHIMKYFNFFRYNVRYQKYVLKSYLDKMNEVEAYKNQFVDLKIGNVSAMGYKQFSYSNNADATLEFLDSKEDWFAPTRTAARATIKETRNIMTVTHNNALDFKGETKDVRIKFNLTRTKIIFTLLKKDGSTENVGGELIDVSIGHRNDANILHFWDNLSDNIITYNLTFDVDCKLTFYSYSLLYLVYDLEYILFEQRMKPWHDPKYVKRLNRLFYLYFVDIFITLESGKEKLNVLRDLTNMVFSPLKDPIRRRLSKQSIGSFKRKYLNKGLMVMDLMDRLEKLISKLTRDDKDAFAEMIDVLINNANIIINSISNIRSYCATDGNVREGNLYKVDVKQLL
uniref:Uncharacterized protein n=1 Tax=Pithovirus LCPAC403 TaxID=2506596 RepID=A0A481ZEG2_9VIRU|nr:MAG: uncharacterized protein LCPAC403_01450 [Pithovirus LCPAC403]